LRETYLNRLVLPELALDNEQVSMQVVPLGPPRRKTMMDNGAKAQGWLQYAAGSWEKP